jgi:hypothetical protein
MANAKAIIIMICLGLILNLTSGGADAAGSINDKPNKPAKGRKPPAISLSASPAAVAMNGSTKINWSSKRASDCTASGDWSGSKATSGSQTMSSLTSDKVFNLSCSGPGGTSNHTVNITVVAPAPTLSFSTSPASVSQNGSTTLKWNSTDATSCVASGDWSGTKGTSGSEITGRLTSDSQFTLTCSGAGSSVIETVNVSVTTPAPTLSFSASPASVAQNDSTTLNWNSTDATSCVASGDWSGSKASSGSQTMSSLTSD